MDRESADGAAHVIVFLEAKTQNRAIIFHGGLGLKFLSAGVAAGHHVLAAVFDPFDRPATFHRKKRDQDGVFTNQMDFLAKPAADVGNDDANVLQSERLAQSIVNNLRNLSRDPNRQSFARCIVGRDDGERLQRSRAVAVNLQIFLDDSIRGFECAVDLAILQSAVPCQVGAQFIEQDSGGRLNSFAHVHHGTERLVLNRNQFQRIFRRPAISSRNRPYRLANIAHFIDGARVFIDGPLQSSGIPAGPERSCALLDVVRSDYRDDVGIFQRL